MVKEALIKLKSVNKSFRRDKQDLLVLNDLTFTIYRGEIVAVLGKSGSGKSTMLKVVSGLTKPDGGVVQAFGKPVDMPVPETVALSFDAVNRIAKGQMPDMEQVLAPFGPDPLLLVRPSSQDPDWGGPSAVLNIGMNDAAFVEYSERMGPELASDLYKRFVTAYAIHVARLDPDVFEEIDSPGEEGLSDVLRCYEDEAEEPFPQDPAVQLAEVLRSMARVRALMRPAPIRTPRSGQKARTAMASRARSAFMSMRPMRRSPSSTGNT